MENETLNHRIRSLEQKLLQKRRELSLLKEMSLFLTNNVQKTLDLVAYRMGVLTDAKFVRLYLVDSFNTKLSLVSGYNLSEKYLEMVKNRFEISIMAAPCGKAVTDRAPYVVNNVDTDDAFAMWRDISVMHGYSSYAAIPLFVADRILGVADIFFEDVKYFSEDELNLITALSNSGALAIENAILIDKLEHVSIIDEDTGVFSRRHFMETLKNEMVRGRRQEFKIVLVMLEIKGADADAVRAFVSYVKNNSRGSDMLFRYSDEIFCLIMTETQTGLQEEEAASKIKGLFHKVFSKETQIKVSVATLQDGNGDAEALVKNAIKSLV